MKPLNIGKVSAKATGRSQKKGQAQTTQVEVKATASGYKEERRK